MHRKLSRDYRCWGWVLFSLVLESRLLADVIVRGQVVDENNLPVAGARIAVQSQLRAQGDVLSLHQTISDATGGFQLRLATPGPYGFRAERENYFRLENFEVHLEEGENEVSLVLNHVREVFESVNVTYSPPAIEPDQTAPQQKLTGTDIINLPYPTTHNLRNALRALPGMVQDSRGGIHLHGGSEDHVLYTLDGFTLNDPLSGRFESRLSVEALRSVEVVGGNLPAGYGKGVAGLLSLGSRTGDDQWRATATNFIPNLQNQKGLVLKEWSPRFNFSGPVSKSSWWFSDSFDMQYITSIVDELPKGQDRTPSLRFSNLFRQQANLTSSNILTFGVLTNWWSAPRSGLSALTPPETTVDRRSRQWFAYVKDQAYFRPGALLEVGYGFNRTFEREIPQGEGFLRITPRGFEGYAFTDAQREGSRDQFQANLLFPSFSWAGTHQFKAGWNLERVGYWQDVRRTGYLQYRLDGSLSRSVVFAGSGRLRETNRETAAFIEEQWRPWPSLLIQWGLRQEWDRRVRDATISPRIGFAWLPGGGERTRISGGFSLIREGTALRWFVRPRDQYGVTTSFDAEGRALHRPSASAFWVPDEPLSAPLYRATSLELQREFPKGILGSLSYVRRRGRNGLTYAGQPATAGRPLDSPVPSELIDHVHRLSNWRRDLYDGVTVSLRQSFQKQYQWMTSYTRSRSFSNAVVELSQEEILSVPDNVGRMPWDAPNRFLSWGVLPLLRPHWLLAYFVEYRTGFPFSIQNDEGQLVGGVNTFRFPSFFELNLHAERRFTWRGHRWALRGGFNNLTNHRNPNVVNNFVGAPDFLKFYGGQPRNLNFRLRWLSKE